MVFIVHPLASSFSLLFSFYFYFNSEIIVTVSVFDQIKLATLSRHSFILIFQSSSVNLKIVLDLKKKGKLSFEEFRKEITYPML